MEMGTCYKITPINDDILRGDDGRNIDVYFNKFLPLKDLPSLKVYFTSEKNSYGVVSNLFTEGEVVEMKIDKNKNTFINLKPEKHIYLSRSKSNCIEASFWECYASNLLKSNFLEEIMYFAQLQNANTFHMLFSSV